MSQYPPYNPAARAYSPSAPYGDSVPTFPPPSVPQQPPREFPPFYPTGAPPPPQSYRPYDSYPSESPRPLYPYEQPRRAYEADTYDPYRPATNAYDHGPLPIRAPPPPTLPIRADAPYLAPPLIRAKSPPAQTRVLPRTYTEKSSDTPEFTLLTPPVAMNVEGYSTVVHALPPSQLPLTKYVSVNRDDAIELHRHLCTRNASIWYADGSSRAGEGWSAAVEWIFDPGRSGSKMRGCVGEGDALDAELGGIYKAVEGFQELLRLSIKNASPMSHQLIVFCDSPAAIVSIDTSSRVEAVKFDRLWREICFEFIQAHMTLVWIPRHNGIEGHILADKIAVVGASNAYLKKKKENTLPDIYRRPGGGEPAPPGSSEAGPWQRGDAEPSRRKEPFLRPSPKIPSPVIHTSEPLEGKSLGLDILAAPVPTVAQSQPAYMLEPEEEVPKAESIFVTHFPETASAKDLGILFSQFGSIESVDIYHVSPEHPRLAYVAFVERDAGSAAIAELHKKPIRLDTPFALENQSDLETWRQWSGTLTVVKAEPPLLVPSAVVADFPNLPEWAKRGRDPKVDEADKLEVEGQIKQERSATPDTGKKREREATLPSKPDSSSPASPMNSPSPHKRPRQEPPLPTAAQAQSPRTKPNNSALSPLVPSDVDQSADPAEDLIPSTAGIQQAQTHQTPLMPPFPPTLNGAVKTPQPVPATIDAANSGSTASQSAIAKISPLPPTPDTAERPSAAEARLQTPPSQPSLQQNSSSKPPLTNSAAEPQEHPIKVGAKTLRSQIHLVRNVLSKHEVNNWIAHSCLIATDLDQARRTLQGDLFATDEAFLSGREFEQTLAARGFTASRVDAFITKVLKVLDGIAAAEEDADANGGLNENVTELEQELVQALDKYPDQTKEAVNSAAKLTEYLVRGKELQEKKRLDIERRVKVLEGMVKIGDVVGGVVRFLLSEEK